MGIEIERKFLVKNDDWKLLAPGTLYRQGYVCLDKDNTVRIRTVEGRGILTIKGKSTGFSRIEFEYEIPIRDANYMLESLCFQSIIEKYRYKIPHKDFIWEVDEFLKENSGLVIAEIELQKESQSFPLPDWVGKEVTGIKKYYNARLTRVPYSAWKKN